MAILALPEFGGGAARVWESISAGQDLPSRQEIDLMARPWGPGSTEACVNALFAQRYSLGACLSRHLQSFLGYGERMHLKSWRLFISPLLAGGAGAVIRPMVDRQRVPSGIAAAIIATIVLGLVAGGIAGVLFVMAPLTADSKLVTGPGLRKSCLMLAARSLSP
jgi:hypothetical protein